MQAADSLITDAAVDAIQGAEAIGVPRPHELLSAGVKTTLPKRPPAWRRSTRQRLASKPPALPSRRGEISRDSARPLWLRA